MPMDMHYCDIFGDCNRCPVPFCPFEKLDDWEQEGPEMDDEPEIEEEDQDDGW